MWKFIRITVLLLVLLVVAGMTWLDKVRTTSWKNTLWIGVFPLNADGSEASARYMRSLTVDDFVGIEDFFADEARRYGVAVEQPVHIELYPAPAELPPMLAPDAGMFGSMWWSLKMRWYARGAADVAGRAPSHIRVFVLFHDPAVNETVPHSLGLQKGLIGVVHAFADHHMRGQNNIVIVHETLHTVGATDKYDPETGAPSFPDGYVNPDLEPRWPQEKAEIMAGKRPVSDSEYRLPLDLDGEAVGVKTAREIGWIKQ